MPARSAGSVVWPDSDTAKMPTACASEGPSAVCDGGGCGSLMDVDVRDGENEYFSKVRERCYYALCCLKKRSLLVCRPVMMTPSSHGTHRQGETPPQPFPLSFADLGKLLAVRVAHRERQHHGGHQADAQEAQPGKHGEVAKLSNKEHGHDPDQADGDRRLAGRPAKQACDGAIGVAGWQA